MSLWTDLSEIKAVLGIDPCNTAENKLLLFLAEWASSWMEEIINRTNFLSLKSRTEYYGGTGTQKLLLRARPVYTDPTIQVYVDESGYFGSVSGAFTATGSQLVYGTDFCLDIKEDGQPSRSGILIRRNAYWQKPWVRAQGLLTPFPGEAYGNIKVIYSGGYTVDTIPAQLRYAANMLVARMRYVLPIGYELTSDSYEDRSIATVTSEKNRILGPVLPMILPFRNFKW